MAKNVQNSHFSFARNIILVENMSLRSSPLHEAAERYATQLRVRITMEIQIIFKRINSRIARQIEMEIFLFVAKRKSNKILHLH